MNCYCENTGTCFNCIDAADKKTRWDGLSIKSKSKLIAYTKLVSSEKFSIEDETHVELSKYIIEKNLCVTTIPVEFSF